MNKKSFFWVGYSDLMTSLFFLMLVLFVISFIIYEVDIRMITKIKNIEKALSNLDPEYFEFDQINKRYKLRTDINFAPNDSDIYNEDYISKAQRDEIKKAGQHLFDKIESIIQKNKDVDYLLIIEGNTQRYKNNYIENPNVGYKLSYKRALALYNFWKDNGNDFRELSPQCEIIIAGSGYFGLSRDTITEQNNRRFTIQLTSKVGEYIQNFKK